MTKILKSAYATQTLETIGAALKAVTGTQEHEDTHPQGVDPVQWVIHKTAHEHVV